MKISSKWKSRLRRIFQLLLSKEKYTFYKNYILFNPLSHPAPLYSFKDFHPNWNTFLNKSNKINTVESKPLIYLISPTQRSGTNYLSYLLSLHTQLQFPEGNNLPKEQFIYAYTEHLQEYVQKTVTLWGKWIKDEQLLHDYSKLLMNNFGNGIINFFYSFIPDNKILFLRSPDSKNIHHFFHLFPNGKVIILIRDGRDTVESFVKSWGGMGVFKKMSIRWSERTDTILKLMKLSDNNDKSNAYLLVKYNELNNDTEKQLHRILDFLALDHNEYDWKKMKDAPVLGSSTYRGDQPNVNWKAIKKDKNFKPHNKWERWDTKKKKIFKKYAGDNLIKMGFEIDNNW